MFVRRGGSVREWCVCGRKRSVSAWQLYVVFGNDMFLFGNDLFLFVRRNNAFRSEEIVSVQSNLFSLVGKVCFTWGMVYVSVVVFCFGSCNCCSLLRMILCLLVNGFYI